MGGLGLIFRRRAIQANHIKGTSYLFADGKGDQEVFRILMAKGVSSDGVGITKDDAARVTDIAQWFSGSAIKSFDEFQYFVNVTQLKNYGSTGAFYDCQFLESIVLPPNMEKVGRNAFLDCKALTSDLIVGNAKEIGESAFEKSAIGSIELRGNNAVYIERKAFQNCKSLKYAYAETVYDMREAAFYGCSALTRIDMRDIISIGRHCFYNCTSLTGDFNLPYLTTFVTEGNFVYSKIKSLTAPLLTNLPYNVFYGCKDLEKVDVSSVGQIIAGAFNQCSSLKILLLRSGAVATLENTTAFSGVNSALAIYVPDVLVDSYKSSSNWTSYASKIKPLSEYQG